MFSHCNSLQYWNCKKKILPKIIVWIDFGSDIIRVRSANSSRGALDLNEFEVKSTPRRESKINTETRTLRGLLQTISFYINYLLVITGVRLVPSFPEWTKKKINHIEHCRSSKIRFIVYSHILLTCAVSLYSLTKLLIHSLDSV